MSMVLVAAIWFVLGVVVCFVSGRGIADGQAPTMVASLATPPPPPLPARRFATLAVHEWTLAADRLALDDLLANPSDLSVRATAE